MGIQDTAPTVQEIQDLSRACDKLWSLDSNRLTPGEDYQLNLQEGKKMYWKEDVAPEKLFTFVNPNVFERPTYQLFYALLDNYERGTGIAEDVTPEELHENNDFINAIMDTKPMQYAYNWLSKKGKISGNQSDFKRTLHDLWFGLYKRESHNDSSGFEHVFVGEVRDGKVVGCHNWIQLYNEERNGEMDYRGYIKPRNKGKSQNIQLPHESEQLLTIQFSWGNEIKPCSTSLIGVSPEFEMALYTMCFLNGDEASEIQLGPYRCIIKSFGFGRGQRRRIGSIFPEAVPMSESKAATMIQSQFRGRQVRLKYNQKNQGNAWNKQKSNHSTGNAWNTKRTWN